MFAPRRITLLLLLTSSSLIRPASAFECFVATGSYVDVLLTSEVNGKKQVVTIAREVLVKSIETGSNRKSEPTKLVEPNGIVTIPAESRCFGPNALVHLETTPELAAVIEEGKKSGKIILILAAGPRKSHATNPDSKGRRLEKRESPAKEAIMIGGEKFKLSPDGRLIRDSHKNGSSKHTTDPMDSQ